MRVVAEHSLYEGKVNIYVLPGGVEFKGPGDVYLVPKKPVEFYRIEYDQYNRDVDDGYKPFPVLSIRPSEAQELMDTRWNSGIRPSNDVASVGQIGAMEQTLGAQREHILSLRRILEIEE